MPAAVMRDYKVDHALTLGGKTLSEGTCDLHLDDAFLQINAPRTSRIPYEEVESVRAVPGGVEFTLFPEGKGAFSRMDGALVRPLFLHLSRLRGQRWASLLRFVDGEPVDTLECRVRLDGGEDREARFHLYANGLVGMPLGGEPFQLGMHELGTIAWKDYRLTCATPGCTAVLHGAEPADLGRFHRAVQGARRKVEEETAALLAEVFPALEFAQMGRLTDLLLRGRAAPKAALDAAVPWLWGRIEEVIATSAKTAESYAFLRARAGEHLWFGLRRLSEAEQQSGAEAPDEAREEGPIESPEAASAEAPQEAGRDFLFWFMAGLRSGARRSLAVEVCSGTKGFATYVYRCPDGADDGTAFADTADVVSRAMVHLNFYREPLYAPAKDIETGRFAEYKLAVRKLPYLRAARERFAGRAIHTTAAAWQRSLEKLLA